MHYYKQRLLDTTRSTLDNNNLSLAPQVHHDLDRIKSYALNADGAFRECQTASSLTTAHITPRRRLNVVHFLPDNFSSHCFPPSTPYSVSNSTPTSHYTTLAFHVTQILPPRISPSPKLDDVLSLDNFLNIAETQSSLSTAIQNQIQVIAGQYRNVL